jgi:folate-binding protein YgfZ
MIEFTKLDQALIFAVSGKHAERYLQARLSNDIRQASLTRAIRAAALSPQGKCEALFIVWRDAAGSFFLLADGGDASYVQERLLAFRVTEQIVVENLSELYHCVHVLDSTAEAALGIFGESRPAYSVLTSSDQHLLHHSRVETPGVDLICKKNLEDSFYRKLLSLKATEISLASFHSRRIQAKQVMFPLDVNNEHLLLDAGLLDAISYTKGCYVGQEVIARIDSQGRAPHKLLFFEVAAEHSVEAGQSVYLQEDTERRRAVGEIASVFTDPNNQKVYCSGYIKNSPEILEKPLCTPAGQLGLL